MTRSMSARDGIALRCAEIGLRPIVGWTVGTGFRPSVRFRDGLATDDVAVARRMLQEHPNADRLGLVMGACRAGNVFALDVDRGHTDVIDGVAECRDWLRSHGMERLPPGPRCRTPRGGVQLLFAAPIGVRIRNMSGDAGLAPGVDVRGHNGLATIPPTARVDGAYRWIDGASILDLAIPLAPAALVEAVRGRPHVAVAPNFGAPRNDLSRERRYIERALDGELTRVAQAQSGGRNAALFHAAAVAASLEAGSPGAVDLGHVTDQLEVACVSNGLIHDDGIGAVRRTIASGFRAGAQSPRLLSLEERRRRPAKTRAVRFDLSSRSSPDEAERGGS